jgi:hypothetical protein
MLQSEALNVTTDMCHDRNSVLDYLLVRVNVAGGQNSGTNQVRIGRSACPCRRHALRRPNMLELGLPMARRNRLAGNLERTEIMYHRSSVPNTTEKHGLKHVKSRAD